MAKHVRKSGFSNIQIEWDDSGLQALFYALRPVERNKMFKVAIKRTLESTQKLAISAANAQGFGATGPASNNGWNWNRRGRLPRAITVGKIWSETGKSGGRVFTKTAKSAGEMSRSPMANAFITGYRQFVPTGEPGKGNVRFTKNQPARPVYKLVEPMVKRIFTDNLKRTVRTTLNRRKKG